jgi:leucyl/phenylalanyl-tRNA--protein transferase
MVLRPDELHVSKSLQKTIGRRLFDVRFDTAFAEVITHCATARRPGQKGTWITGEMIRAYITLHDMGFAHSAEAWREGKLAGGLYGVSLGAAFFGESMFARQPNASKVAFVHLVRQLQAWDFHFVDCQIYTEHLARFGAAPWPRTRFLKMLEKALEEPTRKGLWRADEA